jgi:L-ascorbate metabolism protein UlaG (beta-lactamase superfamily)
MKLTKYTHACVRITDGENRLVIDPGVFSEVETALDGIDAVLITHLHPDHVDTAKLVAAATANPDLRIWGPVDLLAQLGSEPALADRLTRVGPNEKLQAGGFEVATFGGQHALIHPNIPTISNIGFLVGGAVYHPGDSFAVPNASVEVALVPLHAPWSKTSEVVDYTVSVRARRAFQIHDSLLTPIGQNAVKGLLGSVTAGFGIDFALLDVAESVDI